MKLKAIKDIPIRLLGKAVIKGDTFEITDEKAKLLAELGYVESNDKKAPIPNEGDK